MCSLFCTSTRLRTPALYDNLLQVIIRRMQLTFLILSLQLAHIVCAGESLRHSENAGLRRRQSSSSLQAGQVQEEGVVRVSRKRARLSPGLDERDVEEDDNRAESEDQIESRRGVRKGVRKTAKKEDGRGLLKQQILGRPGIAEPVQISKVSHLERFFT